MISQRSLPPTGAPPGGLMQKVRSYMHNWRPTVVTGGAPIFPLMVLFGLNLVDEFDKQAFAILSPEIRRYFGLNLQGLLTLISVVGLANIFLEIPIAQYADRGRRTRIAAGGATAWGVFSVVTGLVQNVFPQMAIARAGTALGNSVSSPTHRSLIADYYGVEVRPAVYAFWSSANSFGQIIGPFAAGFLALWFGWRVPFVVLSIPTFFFVVLALRLKEPIRGQHERRAMGASEEVARTEEAPASLAEAFRILWQVKTARRYWLALPVIAIPLVVIAPLLQIFYADVLRMNTAERGFLAAVNEPFQLVGLALGIPIATRLMRRDPGLLIYFVCAISVVSMLSTEFIVFAQSRPATYAGAIIFATVRSTLAPGLAAMSSLIVPPRVRSLGFTVGSLFTLPALIFAPALGAYADRFDIRTALLLFIPLQLPGIIMLATAGQFVASDIHKIRTAAMAMSEVRAARKRGELKMLLVKDLDVSYGNVQVLFSVDFEIDEGEIVALLGTNGAGKSTLLKTISGIVEADAGAVIFDGQDITYAPPNEVAKRGVMQVPGGRGVFPSLSVAENLRIAGWLYRRESAYVKDAIERVLQIFPVLRERWDQDAGNLSGGEQQMLSLGMVFIAKPRLLMIDELSLGLAPIIVEQLLEIVKAIRAQGTTIILVEQSVNVALTVAETAYFMEKGEIRFHGPTEELLSRPDILRSVFLEGAASFTQPDGNGAKAAATGRARRTEIELRATRALELASNKAVLEVHGLSKSFGGVRAVDDVTFDLREGEILGVIGPNGAGKTTMFDVISGFISADSGRIILDGEDITPFLPEVRSRLGLGRSFQDARLFPALTVRETIALALTKTVKVRDPIASALNLPSVSASERDVARRVEELIDLMGLQAFRDKFVSELSTGSRRIVDLACVVAHEPKVLLFDEPSSGIAQRETEALGPLLQRIRDATGASLLVIEHDMPLITSISDEIIALDLGQFVTRGVPDEVVNHPRVVSSYLGTADEVIQRSGIAQQKKAMARRKVTT